MKRQITVVRIALSIFCLASPAQAQATRPISMSAAQGQGQAVAIDLYRGHGVNLNFRPIAQTIRRAWLDDPSQVTLDFDDPRCAMLAEPGQCAASVIHLRRIEPLNFPNLPATETTLLTVLTDQGLYQFQLVFPESGSPTYSALEIQPDPVRPSPSLTTSSITGQQGIQLIEQGLQVAQARKLIEQGDPLWERVQNCLAAIRNGAPIAQAAAQSGVSQALLLRLAQMGQMGQASEIHAL